MQKIKWFLLIGITLSILFSCLITAAAADLTAEEIINMRDDNE